MTDYLGEIEKSLEKYIFEAKLEPLLQESVSYSLLNAGKRIRPYICLLISDMLCGRIDTALPCACAVEMIHTYSLIHDDLPAMDNDDMRRGKKSNHIVFGEANAILAGDALLSMAASLLAKEKNRSAAGAVMEGAIEMLNGQIMDVNNLAQERDSLTRMYAGKTGGLFCSAVLSAYYISNPDCTNAEQWKRFALDLGMLFQITDDILDIEKDAQEHKITYLSLHPMEEAVSYANSLADSLLQFLKPWENKAAEQLRELIRQLPLRTK